MNLTSDLIEKKKLHYLLNLNYCDNISTLNNTNNLINQIVNDFVKDNDTEIYLVDYQDDLLSLICTHILHTISLFKSINLYFIGKKKLTYDQLNKNYKFISLKKAMKLCKNKKVKIISPYNILYNFTEEFSPLIQVKKYNSKFKKFPLSVQVVNLIEKFTPTDILMAQDFYLLSYISEDRISRLINSKKDDNLNPVLIFKNFCNDINTDIHLIKDKIKVPQENINLYVIELDNSSQDQKILQQAEEVNGIILYKFNCDTVPQLLSSFNYYLKNKSNIACAQYYNIVTDEDIKSYENYLHTKAIYLKEDIK